MNVDDRKDLYICTGPYHVFCCIFLKCIENRERDGELVIVDCFEGAEALFCMVKKSAVFQKAFFMDANTYKKLTPTAPSNTAGKLAAAVKRRVLRASGKKYQGLCLAGRRYGRIFLAGAVPCFIEFALYQHREYGARVMLFDDGLGSRMQWEAPGWKERMIDYIRTCQFFTAVSGKYFFSPDKTVRRYPYCKVQKQCRPVAGDVQRKGIDYGKLSGTVKQVFQYSRQADPVSDLDAIYIGGGYEAYDFLEQFADKDVEAACHCSRIIPRFAVKEHPASRKEAPRRYGGHMKKLEIAYPLEVSFMYQDLSDKILITAASAAVFNPVFIYGKEPYVILAYRLFGDAFIEKMFHCSRKELDRRVQACLIDAYKNPGKICIPQTYAQLDRQLRRYLAEIESRKPHK